MKIWIDFYLFYNQLDESLKFLKDCSMGDDICFSKKPVEYLLQQIDFNGEKCGGLFSLY